MDKKKYLDQLAEELHKDSKKPRKTQPVLVNDINEVWGMDLIDMNTIKDDNENYKYMLVVQDIFSRYAWVKPMKNKSETFDKFLEVVRENDNVKPKKLWVDQGTEFYNKKFENYADKNNIMIYSTFSPHKVSVVERFNKTLKNMMWKEFTRRGIGNQWIDIVDDLVENYNNTLHSTLKMTPKQARDPKNRDEIYDRYYSRRGEVDTKPKYKVGDMVRVSVQKLKFEKGYTKKWSDEVYEIYDVINIKPTVYYLKDYKGEPIKGSFYSEELQKSKIGNEYLVEKILDTRTKKGKKQYLIKWVGFNDRYNSWEDEENIKKLK